MNEREKCIFKAGEVLLAERLMQNIEAIQFESETDATTCYKPFFDAMQALLTKTTKAQACEKKAVLRYICFSYLQSSLYTESYELRIDTYDDRLFGDTTDTYAYWSPRFIFKYFSKDMSYFRSHIGQKIIRIRECEIMQFASRYIMHYIYITQQLVSALIKHLDIPKEATVTFGGYMDQVVVISGIGEAQT